MTSKPSRRVPVLLAYDIIRGDGGEAAAALARNPNIDLLVDSGAFSAHRSGDPIDLDEYIGYLKDAGSTLYGYFALDVIGNQEATNANLATMRKAGLRPWPVFTVGNTKQDLERMYAEADVVGVGGIQWKIWPHSRPKRLEYLKMVTGWAAGRKLHFLGVAEERILRAFHPFSCDTAAWLSSARYGVLQVYLGNGRWIKLEKDSWTTQSRELGLEMERAGFSLAALHTTEAWRYTKVGAATGASALVEVTCRSWLKYVLEFEECFGTRIFVVNGGGPMVMLASGGEYPVERQANRLLGRPKRTVKRRRV